MRLGTIAFGVLLVCTSVLASDPGQPLDCSDWVLTPGFTCSYYLSSPFQGDQTRGLGADLAVDNTGALLYVDPSFQGVSIVRYPPTGAESIAFVQNRVNAGGTDFAFPACTSSRPCPGGHTNTLIFDAANGRLIVPVRSYCNGGCVSTPYDIVSTIVIGGFQRLFDVYQTYQPQPAALTFRVPTSPEALGGADHFDTYYGPLTKPLDFTKAQPLACSYPSSPPSVGDFETVADPLPDPAPGTVRYYLTATTYQGQTRYGRKTTNGHLSGRDPSLLPACVQPTNQ